jgi:metallo-beta-lactamase family protein
MTSIEESKSINNIKEPSIIISGAGMCNGGRIKYHLIQNITRPESTILFVGYQAVETLGRLITDGATEVRILGQQYPVKAKIVKLNGFSSHADKNELLRWISAIKATAPGFCGAWRRKLPPILTRKRIRQSKGLESQRA